MTSNSTPCDNILSFTSPEDIYENFTLPDDTSENSQPGQKSFNFSDSANDVLYNEPTDDLVVIHYISFSNHKANLKRFQLITQMVFLSQSLIISNQQKQTHCNNEFDDDSHDKYDTYVRLR